MKSIDKLREYVDDQFVSSGQAYLQGMVIASSIEAEIAERYMLLPVDADGVPWHIGEEVDGCEIVAMAGYQLYYYDDDSKTIEWCIAKNRRHVKQRTLEDVLNEFGIAAARELNADPDGYGISDKTIAKCVSEIRELLGGERK